MMTKSHFLKRSSFAGERLKNGIFAIIKFLDAGIQDVSTSIAIVHDLIEISPDGDESDIYKHEIVDTRV